MQNRKFEGIWISKEIWLSKELTLQEKVFFVEIRSLDNENGCFASNDYFAEFFGVSKTRASEVINSLIKKEKIESVGFNGRERILKVCKAALKESLKQPQRKVEGSIKEKFNHTINNTNNTTNNKCSSNEELSYKEINSNSYKTKRDILKNRGLKLKRAKQSLDKISSVERLRLLDYFREVAIKNGFNLNTPSDSRNKKLAKILKDNWKHLKEFYKFKELIDWWFEEDNEWCGYAPENCFQERNIEKFKNKNKKINNFIPIIKI